MFQSEWFSFKTVNSKYVTTSVEMMDSKTPRKTREAIFNQKFPCLALNTNFLTSISSLPVLHIANESILIKHHFPAEGEIT